MMALVLVMGLPGSGKTTLCKRLEDALGANALHISFDEIFSYCRITGEQEACSLLGYHGHKAYHSYARIERKICESMIRDGLKLMKTEGKFSVPPYESILWNISNSFIIIDDIFYLQSMRRPFERMARAYSLCYVVVFVDTPLEVALKRNSNRPPKVFISEKTIHRINDELELPPEEEKNFIRYGTSSNLDDLVRKIENVLSEYDNKSLDQKIVKVISVETHDNIWQTLDCELRRCIRELVVEKKSQEFARALSLAKKQIITEFRTNGYRNWKSMDLKSLLQSKLILKNTNS